MTIKEAVEEAKRVTRCAFDGDWMTRQIDDLEQLIQLNILLIASDSLTRYASYEEDKDRELLVRPPYDRIYVEWLIAQIDLRNGEYDKYAISYDVYNARWLSYSKWVALRIRPAGGQAVWQGYYIVGPEGKGLQVLGLYESVDALESAVPSPEIGDAYGVGTEEENTVYIYTRNGGGEGIPDWQPFGSLKGAQGDPGKNGLTPYIGEDGCWWLGEESTGILADPSSLSTMAQRAETAAEAAIEARAGAQSAEAAAKNAALSAEDRKREAAAAAGNAETFAAEAEDSKKIAEEKRLLATRQAEAAEASAKRAESHAASMENAVTLADQSAARALLAAQATAEDRAAAEASAIRAEDAAKRVEESGGGGGTVSDEKIAEAVEKYLTENPVEGGEGACIITATVSGREITSVSHTFEEVYAAYTEGQHIGLHIRTPSGSTIMLQCTNIDADGAFFSATTSDFDGNFVHVARIFSDNTSMYTTNDFDGKDGVSITSVEQTTTSTEDGGKNVITVTLSNGQTSTFEVKNGPKGYSPVRGKDYWTEADKEEIKAYVDEAILGGAW